MSSDFSPELRRELLNDFYAECDELLGTVRDALAALADEKRPEGTREADFEGLYRAVHTLKGIAAIAGVPTAESLAHAMEDLLRALKQSGFTVTPEHLDLLLDAARGLEQVIRAHQNGEAAAGVSELAAALRSAAGRLVEPAAQPSPGRPEPAARKADPIAEARARGLSLWRCTFAPSAARDAQGVNVNSVRQRLSSLGEILSAEPRVQPDASIVFVFTLSCRSVPEEARAWAAEGMVLRPVAPDVETAPHPVAQDLPASLASRIVRVDLTRLDELMRIAGELVIQRSRLEDRIRRQSGGDESLRQIDLGFARSLRDLRKAIGRVRLIPIAEIFARLPLIVRDLCRGSEKTVRVVLEGERTEIDKYVAERLHEVLLHLVRNAFAHGIETPTERAAAGKAAEATLLVRAVSMGDSVVVSIRDDGRGIDPRQIATRAAALGVAVPERLDSNAVLQILASPGFTTQETADRAAGRGIGMAVVASTVRELGGSLGLDSKPGEGTEFVLRLPLSVSIIDAILVSVGPETCAVPQGGIDEIIQVEAADFRRIQQTEVVPFRDGVLPVSRLSTLFGFKPQEQQTLTLLVLSTDQGVTGLLVDRVVGKREVVVRPLSDPLVHVPEIRGATELGDGRPILILDPYALTTGVVRPATAPSSNP